MSHRRAAEWVQTLPEEIRRRPVAFFEDDCRLVSDDPDARDRLLRVLQFVREQQDSTYGPAGWALINLGQAALYPCLDFNAHKDMVISPRQMGAQSYIFNGLWLSRLVEAVPRDRWRGPYMVESWKEIPLEYRLAVYPNVTHQSVVPRAIKRNPITRHSTHHQQASFINRVMADFARKIVSPLYAAVYKET
jgi:hypothetical protein